MKPVKLIVLALVLLISSYELRAASPTVDIKILREEARKLGTGRRTQTIDLDRNGDGKIDQVLLLDEKGNKLFEELDFNFDGEMDDFCYYQGGVLEREEIDTNYDGRIDLWVFLMKGVYVERYEKDSNFDGIVDVVKKFGPKK